MHFKNRFKMVSCAPTSEHYYNVIDLDVKVFISSVNKKIEMHKFCNVLIVAKYQFFFGGGMTLMCFLF